MTDRDHSSDTRPAGGTIGHVLRPASRLPETAADMPGLAPAPGDLTEAVPAGAATPDRVTIPFKGDAQPAPTQ
jgi:hypothetical protein